jgi:hypothetical protein
MNPSKIIDFQKFQNVIFLIMPEMGKEYDGHDMWFSVG